MQYHPVWKQSAINLWLLQHVNAKMPIVVRNSFEQCVDGVLTAFDELPIYVVATDKCTSSAEFRIVGARRCQYTRKHRAIVSKGLRDVDQLR